MKENLCEPTGRRLNQKKPSWQTKKERVVNRAESEFYRNSMNLNGCSLDKFLQHESAILDPRSKLTNEGQNFSTPNFQQNYFYVRVLMPMKNNSHIPSMIKRSFRALQQADPTFLLKPFDRNTKSFNVDVSIT